MRILGISALDKDSTASLVVDGRLEAAVMEERLTREKQQAGFPRRALEAVLEMTGSSPAAVQQVAYPFHPWMGEAGRIAAGFARNLLREACDGVGALPRLRHAAAYAWWVLETVRLHRRCLRVLRAGLARHGLDRRLVFVDHHLSHAAAAWMTSGFERALVLSLDWYGSGLGGGVHLADAAGIRRIAAFDYPDSLGLFYAQATMALGFRASRHEGKLVGLAAMGDAGRLYDQVRARLPVAGGRYRYRSAMDSGLAKRLARTHRREDVAAAWQRVLEDVAAGVLAHHVRQTGIRNVALAGGVCANVRMNQRLFEVAGVEHIFVYPSMGDSGSGSGAALYRAHQAGYRPYRLPHVYLGRSYSRDEVRRALQASGLSWRPTRQAAAEIARLLHAGKVVARFAGRMEYGPRALGNRSILCQATDPSVNDWLNRMLGRSEFMPFAPLTRMEDRHLCYHGVTGAEHAAEFMTITFQCSETMRRLCPAAVHVDGSARPQLVDARVNPELHRILGAYMRLSGRPAIINTSFNMHEEPIVCSPGDALRAFRAARLDVLAMEDCLAVLPGNERLLEPTPVAAISA